MQNDRAIPAAAVVLVATLLAALPAKAADMHGAATVGTAAELKRALADPEVEVVVCAQPIEVTQEIDLGSKDIVAAPGAFVFGADGRLINGRSISRLAANARYPIFMNARPGRYIWYGGNVTYNHDLTWLENLKLGRKGPETGTTYTPRHDGYIAPGVFGAWNDSIRDVTMWSQFHEGKHNDAIEAAQNSLPGKGKACDRTGTIKLPAGTIRLTRPIYYTVGMQIAGSEGNNRVFTTLSVSDDFEATDMLWDLDDNYAIIGVPQNRNNQTRVAVAGGGGDGKSVFWSGLRDLNVETRGRCNGVLLHASMASEVYNVHLNGTRGYRGWVIRGSDDFKMTSTGAAGFDVGYDFLGSCINIDVDSCRIGHCGIGFRIQGPVVPEGRIAGLRINNANIEGADLPFDIHRPVGILITSFTAQKAKEARPTGPGYPVAVVDVSGWQDWPNYNLVFRGATTKGFDRIHVMDGEKQDVWRISTRRIDNRDFVYDQIQFKDTAREMAWTGIDFNLNHEFGPNAAQFRNEPATPSNIGIIK